MRCWLVGFWRVEGVDRKTVVSGQKRPGAEARLFAGMGLPRLKPGPISGTKTRARTNTEILAAPE